MAAGLLDDPRTVLLVGADGAILDQLEASIRAGRASEVVRAPGLAAATDALEERSDVGCLVVTEDLADGSLVAACEADPGYWASIPIVAWVADGDESLAAELTQAGISTYLRAESDGADLTAAVDEALEIYERRRRRAANSSMFETVLESVHRGLFVKDTEARMIRMANTPYGVNPDTVIGKTDVEMWGTLSDSAQETYEDDLQVLETETPIREKLEKHDFPDATIRQETTKVPWYGPDGELAGLAGISIDVGDRAELELQSDKQRKELETYTDYVSHDLRSPLEVAVGNLELARETGDERAFENASEALSRIDQMITDLRAITRNHVTDDNADVPFEGIDIDSPVPLADVAERIWDLVDRGEGTLDVQLSPEARIYSSESALRPIFENLFKNALQHAGPNVTVTVGPTDTGGFYVADDGPGIPPEQRDEVFERGFTTAEDGTGTGLSIVAETAVRWDVSVTESDAGGARFEFHDCLFVAEAPPDAAVGANHAIDETAVIGESSMETDVRRDPDGNLRSVTGGGMDIWGHRNECFFVYTTVEPPVRVQGRIDDMEDTHEFAKCALMVRSGPAEGAPYGGIGKTPSHGTEILWKCREGNGGASEHFDDDWDAYPWYRIDCYPEMVHLQVSADGESWRTIDHRTVELGTEVAAGLAVCSHRADRSTTASVSDVEVLELEAR